MSLLRIFAVFFFCASAIAAPAQIKSQAPGYYRMMIGDFQVTALYDGSVHLAAGVFHDVPKARLAKLFADHFQNAERIPTAVNAYLVHTGKALVLIDAGSSNCFGPTAGRLPDALRAAGYAPEDIDSVLITHMHGDHVCGLATADGKILFPNATVWAAKAEADWWLDQANAAKVPENRRLLFQTAQKPLAAYRAAGRFRTFTGDGEILPGIQARATPGHTPGHTSYLVTSKADAMLILGDIVHSIAVQFAHPESSYEFDSDRSMAVTSRQAVFAEIVKHGWIIADAHLPFPGIGHIRRKGPGYAYVPIEYGPVN